MWDALYDSNELAECEFEGKFQRRQLNFFLNIKIVCQ